MPAETPLIEIRARTKSGQVMPFQVTEILEIDGRPYRAAGDVEQLRDEVAVLAGRLLAIEHILGGGGPPDPSSS